MSDPIRKSPPYNEATAGQAILASRWNEMQEYVRGHVVTHSHTGANEGVLLTGASIAQTSTLSVAGVVSGTLEVNGATSFNGDVTVAANKSLTVSGAITASNGLTVSAGGMNVAGNAVISGGNTLTLKRESSGLRQEANLNTTGITFTNIGYSAGAIAYVSGAGFELSDVSAGFTRYDDLKLRNLTCTGDVTIGTGTANKSLAVNGTITASNGLTVSAGGMNVASNAVISGGNTLTVTNGSGGGSQIATLSTSNITFTNIGNTAGSLRYSSGSGFDLADVSAGFTRYDDLKLRNLTCTGDATIGTTAANNSLTVNGAIKINSKNVIEFGAGVTTKEANNGKIGYGTFNEGALDIVGAGTTAENRRIKLSGSTEVGGPLTVTGLITANSGLSVAGGNVTIGSATTNQSLSVYGNVNAKSMRTGQARRCAQFVPGSSQYIQVPTIAADVFSGTAGFTVQAWVYAVSPLDTYDYERVFDFGRGEGQDNVLLALRSSGCVNFTTVTGTSYTNVESPESIPLNQWTHVAVTFAPTTGAGATTGTARIYINGVEKISGTVNKPITVSRDHSYLAKSNWVGNPYLNGMLAEVSVWNNVQTVLMPNAMIGNESGLVGYWKLDNDANDSCTNTGKIGNGTVQGGATFIESPDMTALVVKGMANVSGPMKLGGTLSVTGALGVTGAITASDKITASNGLTVSAGGINVTGAITANSGMTVPAGGINVTGAITANSGITVPAGGINVTGAITANSGITVPAGGINVTGTITANSGMTVPAGGINVTGAITANSGMTVPAGGINVTGAITANSGMTVPAGGINVTGAITANSGMTVPAGGINVTGAIKINSTNVIEFGADVTAKEVSAGKIGYGTFTSGALDIVGAGTTYENRKIKLWALGGTEVEGPLTVTGTLKIGSNYAMSAPDQAIRMVWGFVDFNGTIVSGKGFSVAKDVGKTWFKITFTTAFTERPCVMVTQHWNGSILDNAVVYEIDKDHCIIVTGDSSGTAVFRHFSFIAIGP